MNIWGPFPHEYEYANTSVLILTHEYEYADPSFLMNLEYIHEYFGFSPSRVINKYKPTLGEGVRGLNVVSGAPRGPRPAGMTAHNSSDFGADGFNFGSRVS